MRISVPHEPFLPYGRQSIDEDDIAAVTEVLRADFLTGGPAVAAFEQALCAVIGSAHAVACANGTSGLHLAALALRLLLGLGGGVVGGGGDLLPTPEAKLSDSGPDYARAGRAGSGGDDLTTTVHRMLLPTPNPFHAGNEEDPDEWRKRRADVFKRTGTRHGPALGVVAKSLLPGEVPLTVDTYMPEED
jgi:hypothetical protein